MRQQLTFDGPEFVKPEPVDRRAQLIARVNASTVYRDGFATWLHDNWSIWLRFEFEASKLRDRGRKHYSARTIGEYIRHSTALREKTGGLKVTDWYWPDCARLYMEVHSAAGFFETRGRH